MSLFPAMQSSIHDPQTSSSPAVRSLYALMNLDCAVERTTMTAPPYCPAKSAATWNQSVRAMLLRPSPHPTGLHSKPMLSGSVQE